MVFSGNPVRTAHADRGIVSPLRVSKRQLRLFRDCSVVVAQRQFAGQLLATHSRQWPQE